MTEPSPPPYIDPPMSMTPCLTDDDLLQLRLMASTFRDDSDCFVTGRQLRALLADHDELAPARNKAEAYGAVIDLLQEQFPDAPIGDLPGEVSEALTLSARFIHLVELDCTDLYADWWDNQLRGDADFTEFCEELDKRIGRANNRELDL